MIRTFQEVGSCITGSPKHVRTPQTAAVVFSPRESLPGGPSEPRWRVPVLQA